MECGAHGSWLVRGHPWPLVQWPKGKGKGKLDDGANVTLRVHSKVRSLEAALVALGPEDSSANRSRSCFDPSKRTGDNTSSVRPRCQSCSCPTGPPGSRQPLERWGTSRVRSTEEGFERCTRDAVGSTDPGKRRVRKSSQEDRQVRLGACRRIVEVGGERTQVGRTSSVAQEARCSATSATSHRPCRRSRPFATVGVRVATAVASRSPSSTNRVSLSCSEEGGPSHGARGHGVDVGSTGGDERRSRLWESNGSGTHFWIDHRCDQESLADTSAFIHGDQHGELICERRDSFTGT